MPSLSSHALDDVASTCSWDGAEEELGSLGGPAGAGGGAMQLQLAAAQQRKQDAAARSMVAAPPPQRPLKWQTKLADRATAAVTLEAHYQVPPHLLFDLLADPKQHDQIFDAILAAESELLEADGPRRKWRLDYLARWTFWRVSGVCQNRLFMWTDSEAGTVTFKLREPGFLRRYEGTWTIKAACGTPLAACAAVGGSDGSSVSGSSSGAGSQPGSPLAAGSSRGSSSSGGGSLASSSSSSSFSSSLSSWADLAASDIYACGGGAAAPHARDAARSGGRGRRDQLLPGPADGAPAQAAAAGPPALKVAPLASVSAAAGASSLPLRISQGLSGAAASLARMQAAWYGGSGSGSVDGGAPSAAAAGSGYGSAVGAVASTVCGWFSTSTAPAHKPWSHATDGGPRDPAAASSSGSSSPRAPPSAAQAPALRGRLPSASIITASTLTSPKITPPYPLNQALKSQSKGQVADMLEGLVRAAAARLQAQPLAHGL